MAHLVGAKNIVCIYITWNTNNKQSNWNNKRSLRSFLFFSFLLISSHINNAGKGIVVGRRSNLMPPLSHQPGRTLPVGYNPLRKWAKAGRKQPLPGWTFVSTFQTGFNLTTIWFGHDEWTTYWISRIKRILRFQSRTRHIYKHKHKICDLRGLEAEANAETRDMCDVRACLKEKTRHFHKRVAEFWTAKDFRFLAGIHNWFQQVFYNGRWLRWRTKSPCPYRDDFGSHMVCCMTDLSPSMALPQPDQLRLARAARLDSWLRGPSHSACLNATGARAWTFQQTL